MLRACAYAQAQKCLIKRNLSSGWQGAQHCLPVWCCVGEHTHTVLLMCSVKGMQVPQVRLISSNLLFTFHECTRLPHTENLLFWLIYKKRFMSSHNPLTNSWKNTSYTLAFVCFNIPHPTRYKLHFFFFLPPFCPLPHQFGKYRKKTQQKMGMVRPTYIFSQSSLPWKRKTTLIPQFSLSFSPRHKITTCKFINIYAVFACWK